jgi:hypothetical protein
MRRWWCHLHHVPSLIPPRRQDFVQSGAAQPTDGPKMRVDDEPASQSAAVKPGGARSPTGVASWWEREAAPRGENIYDFKGLVFFFS